MFTGRLILSSAKHWTCRRISYKPKREESLLKLLLGDAIGASPSAPIPTGSSRAYDLGLTNSKYACIGGMSPTEMYNLLSEDPEHPRRRSNEFDHLKVDISKCPKLLTSRIDELVPIGVVSKRLRIIRVYPEDPNNRDDIACLKAVNQVMAYLTQSGAFAIYSGERSIRKPLYFYLENDYQYMETNTASLHVKLNKFNGCTKIEPLNVDDVGVIYTDIKYDVCVLKLFIAWALSSDTFGFLRNQKNPFRSNPGL